MRRVAAALALTFIGLYFVLSFKSSSIDRAAALHAHASASKAATTRPPSGPPGDDDERGFQSPPSTAAPPKTAPVTGTRTITGPVVSTRYGNVQVAVTMSGQHIVDVKALELPYDRPRSAYISQQAGPYLRQEALAAQSARIDAISGATFTSEAYAESLQAALDKA